MNSEQKRISYTRPKRHKPKERLIIFDKCIFYKSKKRLYSQHIQLITESIKRITGSTKKKTIACKWNQQLAEDKTICQ